MRSDRQVQLLTSPRWSWLDEFTTHWCAAPIAAADASPSHEIDEAQRRVDGTFPTSLTQWFEIVGRRLDGGWADFPARCDEISRGAGPVVKVWTEMIDCWSVLTPLTGGDADAILDDPDGKQMVLGTQLPRIVHSLTVFGTVGCGSDGETLGPLGMLSRLITGGTIDAPEDEHSILDAYPVLPIAPHLVWEVDVRGTTDTLLFFSGDVWRWIVRSSSSFDRLRGVAENRPIDINLRPAES